MAHQGQQIVNPRTGQRMTFVELTDDLLRIDSINPARVTEREPLHLHPKQESEAQVLSRALVFEVKGERRPVACGETISIPTGTPHRFWNEGAMDARSIQTFRPALRPLRSEGSPPDRSGRRSR
jgi:hypothetical protein